MDPQFYQSCKEYLAHRPRCEFFACRSINRSRVLIVYIPIVQMTAYCGNCCNSMINFDVMLAQPDMYIYDPLANDK
jgi:hypothetical protein